MSASWGSALPKVEASQAEDTEQAVLCQVVLAVPLWGVHWLFLLKKYWNGKRELQGEKWMAGTG